MNKNRILVGVGVVSFFVAFSGNAVDSLWFRPVDGYSWTNTANWLTGSNTAMNRVPVTNDVVSCNSSKTPPATPLLIDGNAECWQFNLANGNYSYEVAAHVTAGATLSCVGWYNATALLVGGAGHGVFAVDAGSFVTCTNIFRVAENTGGDGTVTNAGTILARRLEVGYAGTGEFYNNGSLTLSPDSLVMGVYNNGTGHLVFDGGSVRIANVFAVGLTGKGVVEANSPFSCSSLQIGTSSNGLGCVYMNNGATGTVNTCYLGGRNWESDTNTPAIGTLWMRGGKLSFSYANLNTVLFVRYGESATGTIRGWGSFNEDNTVRMQMNGCVIADGEGVDGRTLDMHYIISTSNNLVNGYSGTNGWYAVNKGRLLYPRIYVPKSGATRQFGVYPDATPTMVNSMNVTMSFTAASLVVEGALYAPDCSAIPQGLPQDKSILGAWSLWAQTSWNDSTRARFSSCEAAIRYDHTQIFSKNQYIWVYRYENGKWVCLKKVHPGEIPTVSTGALTELSGETYNVGWIALMVGFENGTTVSIR